METSATTQGTTISGETLPIYTFPDPILKKKAKDVSVFDDKLKALCEDMLRTMYLAPGIGLAGPQIGLSQRLFVLDIDFEREEFINAEGKKDFRFHNLNPQVFINPVITQKSGETIYKEGCLSLPGIYEEVKRYEQIEVEFFDPQKNPMKLNVSGLLSICIQHECDHLDGIVFLDRLNLFKKNLLKKRIIKEKKKRQK